MACHRKPVLPPGFTETKRGAQQQRSPPARYNVAPHVAAGKQDAGSAADMDLVHELLVNHAKIKRTVTNLPNGIKTVTESDDPQVAQAIKAHVASMSQRLKDGREFNIFSKTLPVLFENRDKIKSVVEVTAKGTIVTRTSTDAKVVVALQGHASEVTELAQEGPEAMRRGMMARMAMGTHGPRAGAGSGPHFARLSIRQLTNSVSRWTT